MLGKLLKYEFRAMRRFFIPIYVLYFISSVIIRFFTYIEVDGGTLQVVLMIMSALIMLAFFALSFMTSNFTLFYAINRFNKNLFTDEGYLMNTLPVPQVLNVLTKLISALCWILIGSIVNVLGYLIITINSENMYGSWGGIVKMIDDIVVFAQDFPLTAVLIALTFIMTSVVFVLSTFFATTVGHLANKKKTLLGASSFVGIMFVVIIISSIISEIYVSIFESKLLSADELINYALVFAIVTEAILSFVFLLSTVKIMEKKLNLE